MNTSQNNPPDSQSPERQALAKLDQQIHLSRQQANRGTGHQDAPGHPMAGATRLGVEFVACIGVGIFLGISLDGLVHTTPWGTIGLTLMGVVTGFVSAWRMFCRWEDDAAEFAADENSSWQGQKSRKKADDSTTQKNP